MLNLINSAYIYDARKTDNPIETCFLHDDGSARRRLIAQGQQPPKDNVLWGALFEEARHLGKITIRLDAPMKDFGNYVALQYALPGIEWCNSKAYTWYQGHYEDYPLYPEHPDDQTVIYHPACIFTMGLRLVNHPKNFPLNFNTVPSFTVTVEGPELESFTLRVESGLWGTDQGVSLAGCYNGYAAAREENGILCLDIQATEKEKGFDRTIVTLHTAKGDMSFLPQECKRVGHMAVPDFGTLIYASEPPAAIRDNPYTNETIRERVKKLPFRTFEDTTKDIGLKKVNVMPGKTDTFTHYDVEPSFITPDTRMNEHWKIGLSHLMSFCTQLDNGRWDVKIGPYPMFGMESAPIVKMLEIYGRADVAKGAIDVFLDSASKHRPEGCYLASEGCLHIPYGIWPTDSWNPYDPGYILLCLAEHYFYSRDQKFLQNAADKILGCVDWIFREIDGWKAPGALDSGLMPPTRMGDISDWDCYFVGDAVSYMGVANALAALTDLEDPRVPARLTRLEQYRQDIRTVYRRALSLSPVVALKNGTYAPSFATKTYLRGWMCDMWPLSPTNALRGAWLDVDHSLKISEAGVFGPDEIETRWILDAFEDNMALNDYLLPKKWDDIRKDPVTGARDATAQQTDYDPDIDWLAWGGTGWQNGYCPLMQAYLRTGEAKAYIRTFYNTYAIHADPDTYWLREHGASLHYPPKTFEEGWMLWRLRATLVWDEPQGLRLCRCCPDDWYEKGFEVKDMPTFFGLLDMKCENSVVHIQLHTTAQPEEVLINLPGGKALYLDPARTEWTVKI